MNLPEEKRYAHVRAGIVPKKYSTYGSHNDLEWVDYKTLSQTEMYDLARRCDGILEEKGKKPTTYTKFI